MISGALIVRLCQNSTLLTLLKVHLSFKPLWLSILGSLKPVSLSGHCMIITQFFACLSLFCRAILPSRYYGTTFAKKETLNLDLEISAQEKRKGGDDNATKNPYAIEL